MIERPLTLPGMHPCSRSNCAKNVGACALHRGHQVKTQRQVRSNRR